LVLLDLVVAIVTRRKGARGFEVQPRRWVGERTFGGLTRWRRLNRNYEHTLESSRAVVQIAMIGIMARRPARTHQTMFSPPALSQPSIDHRDCFRVHVGPILRFADSRSPDVRRHKT